MSAYGISSIAPYTRPLRLGLLFVYLCFYNHVAAWADNADVLSRQYAGTGALKTDFTRYKNQLISCTSYFLHCVREKSKPQTVLDRIVKSQCILTKLSALYSEYIFERMAKFC